MGKVNIVKTVESEYDVDDIVIFDARIDSENYIVGFGKIMSITYDEDEECIAYTIYGRQSDTFANIDQMTIFKVYESDIIASIPEDLVEYITSSDGGYADLLMQDAKYKVGDKISFFYRHSGEFPPTEPIDNYTAVGWIHKVTRIVTKDNNKKYFRYYIIAKDPGGHEFYSDYDNIREEDIIGVVVDP